MQKRNEMIMQPFPLIPAFLVIQILWLFCFCFMYFRRVHTYFPFSRSIKSLNWLSIAGTWLAILEKNSCEESLSNISPLERVHSLSALASVVLSWAPLSSSIIVSSFNPWASDVSTISTSEPERDFSALRSATLCSLQFYSHSLMKEWLCNLFLWFQNIHMCFLCNFI